jgi:hypothetical protein
VGKGRPARKADNLAAICGPIFYNNGGRSLSHNPMASMACHKDGFTFTSFASTHNVGPVYVYLVCWFLSLMLRVAVQNVRDVSFNIWAKLHGDGEVRSQNWIPVYVYDSL